jgi:MFS family permease
MQAHRNRWQTTVLLFAVTSFVESLAFGHLSAFTPQFLREIGVAGAQVERWTGILSALGFILGLPLLPFWAVWADRFGRKPIIIRSSVAAALIYALTASAGTLNTTAFARFLGGFVLGNTGVMMALQADITPKDRLGRAVAFISAGSPLGMAVGPALGGRIAELYGIRTLLWIDTVLTAVVVLMLVVFLREEPRTFEQPKGTRDGIRQAVSALVHTPGVRSVCVAAFVIAFGFSAVSPYVPLLTEHLYRGGHLLETIGMVISAFGVPMAIATPVWGPIADRFGHLQVLRFCCASAAAAMLGHAVAGSVSGLLASRVLLGACAGGLSSMTMVLLALYSPPSRRSAVLTLSLLPNQLAWFTGPLAGSIVVGLGIRAPFALAATGLAVGVVICLLLKPPPHTVDGT